MLYSKKFVKQNPLTELNQFLLQVKQAFNTDDFNTMDDIIKESKKPKEPLQEILENANVKSQKPLDIKPQSSEELSQILTGISHMLEKNLQESHQLQQLLQVKEEHPVVQPQLNTFTLDDKGIESLQSEIESNDHKMYSVQNQRLMQKIHELNEQISDLEGQVRLKLHEEQELIQTINTTSCIQRVLYSQELGSQQFESGVLFIQDNCIQITQDYLSTFLFMINIPAINNVSYPEDQQICLHYNGKVLILMAQSQQEFQKLDMAIWCHCKTNSVTNFNKLFQNKSFPSPFFKEEVKPVVVVPEPRRKPEVKINVVINQGSQTQSLSPAISKQPPQTTPSQFMIQSSPDETAKIHRALALLKQGFSMVKYSSSQRKPNFRVVYLTQNDTMLKWKEPLEPFDKKESTSSRAIRLADIKEVKNVGDGPGFAKFSKQRIGKEDYGITIVANRLLELDASAKDDKILFIECLQLAMKHPFKQQ